MYREPSTLTLLARNFWLLFGGIFLVAGLLLFVIGAGMAWQDSRFASEGQRVRATVLGKSIDRGDADEGTRYYVHYRFTDPEGIVRDGSDQVPFDVYDNAVEERPIEVEFVAHDPETNRVVGSDGPIAWLFLGIGALAAVGGGATAAIGLRGIRRERRLWRSGAIAEADVTFVEEANVRINRRPTFRVRYRYRDPFGASRDGVSGYLPFDEVADLRPGDRGMVRYDPKRPEDSIWAGPTAPDR